jgi:hypothetical protein
MSRHHSVVVAASLVVVDFPGEVGIYAIISILDYLTPKTM